MRITPLNRKLFRDLLAMKGQAIAIAMVVAAGVAVYVMYMATFTSLQRTERAYYQRQRFADVFASLKRAPLRDHRERGDDGHDGEKEEEPLLEVLDHFRTP